MEEILAKSPDYPMARELLALAESNLDRREAAEARMVEVLERGQELAETRYNLGVFLTRDERLAEALIHFERAIELRPNMGAAWLYLGLVQARMGRLDDAGRSLRRALALEPTDGRAYLALGRVLMRQDLRAEALRYWRHGTEHAEDPKPIAEALARAEWEPPADP